MRRTSTRCTASIVKARPNEHVKLPRVKPAATEFARQAAGSPKVHGPETGDPIPKSATVISPRHCPSGKTPGRARHVPFPVACCDEHIALPAVNFSRELRKTRCFTEIENRVRLDSMMVARPGLPQQERLTILAPRPQTIQLEGVDILTALAEQLEHSRATHLDPYALLVPHRMVEKR